MYAAKAQPYAITCNACKTRSRVHCSCIESKYISMGYLKVTKLKSWSFLRVTSCATGEQTSQSAQCSGAAYDSRACSPLAYLACP